MGGKRSRSLLAALVMLASLLATPVASQASTSFAQWLDGLWPEARSAGISRATFDLAFKGVVPDLTLPDLVVPGRPPPKSSRQAEFSRTPEQYVDKAQIERLAAEARVLAERHRAILDRMEAEIGVDQAAVLAIWGRETAFGRHKPRNDAIRALATLAFTGRRPELFRRELIFALKLIEDGVLRRDAMASSWAGAMGLTQFMPSEFYASGVDLDRDGRLDLFHSVADALGSAARQLQQKGWVKGLPWGIEVTLGSGVDCALEGPANERAIAEWVRLGVRRADGQAFPAALLSQKAYIMAPAGAFGPNFLATENFKVIRAYNTSDLYALFVGHLADRVAGGGPFRTPWQKIRQLPDSEIAEIQQRLKDAGGTIDKIDGKIGSNTRWQIGAFERRIGAPVGCWPRAEVLAQLRSATAGRKGAQR